MINVLSNHSLQRNLYTSTDWVCSIHAWWVNQRISQSPETRKKTFYQTNNPVCSPHVLELPRLPLSSHREIRDRVTPGRSQSSGDSGRPIHFTDANLAVGSRLRTIWAAGSKIGDVAMNSYLFPASLTLWLRPELADVWGRSRVDPVCQRLRLWVWYVRPGTRTGG